MKRNNFKSCCLLWITLCGLFAACTAPMADLLYQAESCIESFPDSALHLLNRIQYEDLSEAQQAKYGVLMFQALDMNYEALQPDSLIDFSIRYGRSHSDRQILSKALLYKGRKYSYALQEDSAMYCYMEALDVADKGDYALYGRLYENIYSIHYNQNEYVEAVKNMQLSTENFDKAGFRSHVFATYLMTGDAYLLMDNCSQKAYDSYMQAGNYQEDSIQQGMLIERTAYYYYKINCFDSSLYYYKQSLHFQEAERFSYKYYYISDMYADMNELDSAYKYVQLSLASLPDLGVKRECYRVMVFIESSLDHKDATQDWLVKYININDTLANIGTQLKAFRIEELHQKTVAVEQAHKLSQVQLFVIVLLLLFLVSLTVVFVWHRKRTYRKTKNRLRQANEVVFKEKSKSEQLTRSVLEKNLSSMQYDMEAIRSQQCEKERILDYGELYRKKCCDYLSLDSYKQFEGFINHHLFDFIIHLQKKCPSLSKKEVIICCLFLLGCRNEDVSFIMKYDIKTLYTMRTSLKKRIDNKHKLSLALALEHIYYGE